MSALRLLTQSLSLQTVGPATTDDYGNAIPGALGAPVTVQGYLEQSVTKEYLDARQTTVTDWQAYLPADTSIHPMDFITYGGQKFQVSGEPWHVYNPRTSAVSHIQCKLVAVS